MGTLKTTNIQTITGSGTLTLGTSGETLVYGSGVTSNLLYPAFDVTISTNQTLTDGTFTKIQFDNVNIDTDSAFDNTTNYRYTIPSGKGGKYFILARAVVQGATTQSNNINTNLTAIYKNGSNIATGVMNAGSTHYFDYVSSVASILVSLSAGDYLEMFVNSDAITGAPRVRGDDYYSHVTCMQGYRIGT